MGQTLFSRELVRQLNPKSVHSVALVSKSDEKLEPLLKDYGCEVVVCPPEDMRASNREGERRVIAVQVRCIAFGSGRR
jgi:hypothetical protein